MPGWDDPMTWGQAVYLPVMIAAVALTFLYLHERRGRRRGR